MLIINEDGSVKVDNVTCVDLTPKALMWLFEKNMHIDQVTEHIEYCSMCKSAHNDIKRRYAQYLKENA